MRRLHQLTLHLVRGLLWVVALVLLVVQSQETNTFQELLPLSSFAIFLSLAGFAMNWARLGPPLMSQPQQQSLHRSAQDLMLSSLLGLLSAGVIWLTTLSGPDAGFPAWTLLRQALLASHWLLLCLSLLWGLLGVDALLNQMHPERMQSRSRES
jgi:hypothetical protein